MKINVTLKKKSLQGTNNFNFSKGEKKKKSVCKSKLSATGPQPQGLQQVLQIENFRGMSGPNVSRISI